MLLIQKTLREYQTIDKDYQDVLGSAFEVLAKKPYSLKVTEDKELGVVMFKYNQIDSDFNNPLVRECRGIILEKDTWNIVAHPFHKFGNFGESYVPDIDWESAKVQEKIDGSLLKVWYYKDKWRVSTNGSINAYQTDLPFSNAYMHTFGYLFNAAKDIYNFSVDNFDRQYTYIFEICSKFNRVVVPHSEIKLYHLATKHTETGDEIDTDIGVPKPKVLDYSSLEECIEVAEKLNFTDEGFVVVDKNLNRIKIKGKEYLKVHRLRGEDVPTHRRILDIVRTGEQSEFLSYFPEYKEDFKLVEKLYKKYKKRVSDDISLLKKQSFEDRKETAKWVMKNTLNSKICFNYLDGKIKKVQEGLDQIETRKLLEYIRKDQDV